MNFFPDQVFVGLQEVPDEISLIIPLAGCGHTCSGCHSSEYQDPTAGKELTVSILEHLLEDYRDKCSCVCVFGGEHGDYTLSLIYELAHNLGYKTALYSGYDKLWDIPHEILMKLDYLKLGEYVQELGGLAEKTTNQRMYRIDEFGVPKDITKEFWR